MNACDASQAMPGISHGNPGQNGNQQPPPPGSCTTLISQIDAATATHSNKLQSWTSQPKKSRSSCKNMQSFPGIKPKGLQGRVDRPDNMRPHAPGQRVAQR